MADLYGAVWRQLAATIYIGDSADDPMAGPVELVSAGTFRLLGYHDDEFIRDSGFWRSIIHPDDVTGVVEKTQEILRLREPNTRIYRLRHAVSGEYRWIEDSTAPLSDGQGNLIGIAGVARDISVLKQAEHELQERQRQLEALMDAMDALPDGVLVVDNSGLILRSNAAVERILGWNPQELAGRTVEDLVPMSSRGAHARLRFEYAAAPQIRRMGTYELAALHKEGREVPVDIMLGPLPGAEEDHVLVLIRDMTDHVTSRQRLALLSSIVTSSDESIIGTDLDGIIVSWNRGAEQLFGYTEEEALGKHLLLLYPPEIQSEYRQNLERIRRREHPPRYDSRRVRKDGLQLGVSVIVSPIEDGRGRLLGACAIYRDITELKRAEAALQVAKQTAEIASQTKSEFLANMSHEIRTPLNGILGLTDVVLDSELTEEQREHLTLVKVSANRLLTILSDILDIAKIQSGKYVLQPKQFWVRDLVDATMKEFQAAAQGKHLRLTWHIQPDVPPIFLGDSVCLRQILSNLVENGIKFTDAGEVEVTVETSPQDPGVLFFRVRDTGMGISMDQQRTIFEPFSQVDNSLRRRFGGTGLGLAICAQLVEIMGGRIWVYSDGHTGSTFHVTVHLEAVDALPEKTAPEREVKATSPERRREMRRAVRDMAQMKILRPFTPLPWEIEILDVSKSGLKVGASQALAPGALVQISLKKTITLGEVRYCVPAADRFHLGLKIISVSAV